MSELNAREISKRFTQFIMMQAQNIMYVLGRMSGPDGSAPPPNLRAAKLLIDQLEMIEAKTKGNLTEQESTLLANILSEVRLVFVETSGGVSPGMIPDSPYSSMESDEEESAINAPSKSRTTASQHPTTSSGAQEKQETKTDSTEIQSKRKFFKSYG